LKLILSEHPYSCLVCPQNEACSDFQGTIRKVGVTTGCQYCPKNGQCELQALVEYLDLREMDLPIAYRGLPVETEDPFFDRDYNLCILCGRCVRVCQEVRHRGTLAFTYRSNQALVGTAFGRSHLDSDCEFCGSCVDVCPVGALADKRSKWEGKPERTVSSICPYCSLGCTLDFNLKNGRVISTKPNRSSQLNQGQACVRGRFGIVEMIHNESRLKSPMIKINEQWEEVSWEEAVQKCAENFTKYDPTQCAVITSPNCTNEDNFVFQKFARVALKTNNVDFYESYLNHRGLKALFQINHSNSRTLPIQEISAAKCILLVGSNPSQSHPVAAVAIKKALQNGAKLVVIDPRKIELASLADIWLQPGPETDAIVLMGLMKALLMRRAGAYSILAGHYERAERLLKQLENFDVASIEGLTGISTELIIQSAALLDDHKPPVIIYGSGISQHPTSTETIYALHNLSLFLGIQSQVTGLIPLVGPNNIIGAIDMGAVPDTLPGHVLIKDKAVRNQFEKAWDCTLNEKPGRPFDEILQGIEDGQIKALYLIGEVPAFAALQKLDFLAIQNIYPPKNMEFAQVVLPAASFAEVSGTYTNFEGRVQRLRQIIKPLYQSKPDWWITSQIARKMGVAGFEYENSAKIMTEIAQFVPGYKSISYRRLKKNGLRRMVNGHNGKYKFYRAHIETEAAPQDERFPLTLLIENSLFRYRAGSLVEHVNGMEQIKQE
ncbi:MAG: molybdopterin-dependent oxidoreductase, partial [bacterium]